MKIVQLNEEVIKSQIKELVRGSVEETLNELLEKEAESLTQAARYERSEARQGYRSGHYDRNLTTTSGDVTLHVPRLKGVPFETAIIERYRRRESSVEEALIEMYLAGVSVRRVEDITEALWGSKVSPATISELNKKAHIHIEDFLHAAADQFSDLTLDNFLVQLYSFLGHSLLAPFECLCGNFILPEFCKLCLFLLFFNLHNLLYIIVCFHTDASRGTIAPSASNS